ncbi:MAG: hypothetical protein AB2669_13535 [Candidatus Thiodiazotropha endolucinida]|nr:hypothetical protein [Candidatus Thiodiazotropha sp. (ex Lucina pensylvanica)]MCG7875085.1 hypothetical protein [Candidatus Thiodiazotropha taylori]MCG8025505.1 hypothetical protein [Candidatus Thiodiazotropha endolucinida]MCG7882025.1 hypothetical protein [Candidatus Thiodiazotropha taylori]MCG7887516.1 hypothetical protein [Candidatus Thiodiazotropha taylori]
MNTIERFFASSVMALSLLYLPLTVSADDAATSINGMTEISSESLDETLVIVNKIVGVDAEGNEHILYNEDDGRVYRLNNINQAIHDMNAKGVDTKGTFWSLQAVLSDTVYLMGKNNNPYPAQRVETAIPESLPLAVENLRITKDRVIAIYTTNCDNNSI